MFLEGRAEPIRLAAGDYVHLPAHTRHRVEWTDYDKSGEHAFDVTFFASYGVEAQLERWRAALDYVAPRLGRVDAETQALVVDVTLSHNGRPPYRVRLQRAVPQADAMPPAGAP